MGAMTSAERSAFGKAAVDKRHQCKTPPIHVIKHMLEAVRSSGKIHLLFRDGEQMWHAERDSPAHAKMIRAWEIEGFLLGAYGPGVTTADVLNDVLAG
jgi:hypothetical protein